MPTPKRFRCALLLAVLPASLIEGQSQQAPDAKYPLHLHVLAIDDTHRTVRMQPNWCSGSVPGLTADAGASGGPSQGDPCGNAGSSLSFGGDDDFSGSGRADLVTPPTGTQALNFTYEGCSRMRVPPGFQGLPARWKKPGKLEILLPTDAISTGAHAAPAQRCTLKVVTHEFVYLRLRNGTILKVSQEAYDRKPSLRVFLSGGSETLQQRMPPTVSVKQLMQSPQGPSELFER